MRLRLFQLVTLSGSLICAAVAYAGQVDTVYISASRDVTLYEDALGALANGSGQYCFAGRADSTASGKIRRALIHFDIAGNVPAGAYIAEAAMTLNMSQTSSDSQLVGVHRLLTLI